MKRALAFGLGFGAASILALAILNQVLFNNIDIQPEGEW